MPIQIDTNEESQVAPKNQAKQARTIYDAGYGEIFWKSFVAGLSLGLGKTVASILFYIVILGIFVTYMAPFIDQLMAPMNRLIPILEQSGGRASALDQQMEALFGSIQRPAAPTDTEIQ